MSDVAQQASQVTSDNGGRASLSDPSQDIVIRIAYDRRIPALEWIKLRNELTSHVIRKLEKAGRADLLKL